MIQMSEKKAEELIKQILETAHKNNLKVRKSKVRSRKEDELSFSWRHRSRNNRLANMTFQ